MRKTILPACVVENPEALKTPFILIYFGTVPSRIAVSSTGKKEYMHDFHRMEGLSDEASVSEKASELRKMTDSQLKGVFKHSQVERVSGWRRVNAGEYQDDDRNGKEFERSR